MSSLQPPRSKTIDNLGIDSSVRYAQDQEYLDTTLIKESTKTPLQIQIDVTTPCFPSEFELMFGMSKRYQEWAGFVNPEGFKTQKGRLFTFQTIPALGDEDNYEVQAQRLRDLLRKDQENRKRRQKPNLQESYEEEIELQEEEQEIQKILSLIAIISNLDKILGEINSRRNQYQKG